MLPKQPDYFSEPVMPKDPKKPKRKRRKKIVLYTKYDLKRTNTQAGANQAYDPWFQLSENTPSHKLLKNFLGKTDYETCTRILDMGKEEFVRTILQKASYAFKGDKREAEIGKLGLTAFLNVLTKVLDLVQESTRITQLKRKIAETRDQITGLAKTGQLPKRGSMGSKSIRLFSVIMFIMIETLFKEGAKRRDLHRNKIRRPRVGRFKRTLTEGIRLNDKLLPISRKIQALQWKNFSAGQSKFNEIFRLLAQHNGGTRLYDAVHEALTGLYHLDPTSPRARPDNITRYKKLISSLIKFVEKVSGEVSKDLGPFLGPSRPPNIRESAGFLSNLIHDFSYLVFFLKGGRVKDSRSIASIHGGITNLYSLYQIAYSSQRQNLSPKIHPKKLGKFKRTITEAV